LGVLGLINKGTPFNCLTSKSRKNFNSPIIDISNLSVDGVVLKMLENLIAFVDEVNDRPVWNPKRRFDEYSSKFPSVMKPRLLIQ
jgi:hypothetical protein